MIRRFCTLPFPILLPLVLLLLATSWTTAQQTLLQSGPMVGYGQMTEVMIWVQTREAASVQIRYWDETDSERSQITEPALTTDSEAFIAHILIDGLTPGKRFGFEVLINGAVVQRPYPLRFQTQPLWQWRTDPPEFTVAFGSCAYINEAQWDRPGTPYGSDYQIFQAIAAASPDLMIWLGDNTYYREIDWNTVRGLLHRQTHTRSLPEMQPLLGATHNYAIWDDHDYGPNDSDRSYRLKGDALAVHKLFWANQTYGTPEIPGVFGSFEWGDVEFFLLDDRYYRSPNRSPDDENKTMFGKEQLQWLMDALLSSRAPFKIVVNGNQILNPSTGGETFFQFSFEYEQLIQFIKRQEISGVIFLSGDRHLTELVRLDDPAFYPLYDYTSSSLTAGLSSFKDTENPHVVSGTLVNDAHTFGLLRFSGPRTDRQLTMECYDYEGSLRWSHTVKARELRVPR